MNSCKRAVPTLLAAACLASSSSLAQEIVFPRAADKSQVRYFDFDWRHIDILVGPESEKKLARSANLPGPPHPSNLPPEGEVGSVPTAPVAPDDGPITEPGSAGETGISGGMPSPNPVDGGTPGGADGGVAAQKVSPWIQTLPDGGIALDGGTPLPPRTGGVRLYYYQREQAVAERATSQIISAYRHLVDKFDYVPTKTFPYILYNSYQEFLETNLFPLQEGVLGVTSPVDLKLTLPYFGDHRMFEQVSLHEMAHQFTIQKIRTAVERSKVQGEPLEGIPLWFIEGLAEVYAHGGIDDEAEMLIRDIVVNPSIEKGYAMLDFFEDRPQSVLWTYKVGQVRCAFLEEAYGEGTIQRVLNASTALVGGGGGMMRRPGTDFAALLERLTGDEPKAVSRKFEAWLKRRAFKAYLGASQDTPQVKPLAEFTDRADSMATSPDGDLILYRTLEPETYRGRLQLMDRRAPGRPLTVVADGVPGVESLHLVFGRSFAVGRDSLIYVAQAGGGDVIYWRKVDHRVIERPAGTVMSGPMPFNPTATTNRMRSELERFQVQLAVGPEVKFALRPKGLIAAYGPALAPDGRRVAFVGLNEAGVRDVYVLTPKGGSGEFDLLKLTNDTYGERQVAWAPDDSIVFNSDATGTRKYNLFRVKLSGPEKVERLTSEDRDELDPTVLPDGRVMFVAYANGSADIHEVKEGQIIRRTDVATGFFDVGPGPDGGVWALFHHAGERSPVLIKTDQLISAGTVAQGPRDAPQELERTALTGSQPYSMFNLQNWEPGNPYALISGGVQGIYGQVFANAADRLRNHAVVLFASVYGSFDLTDGFLIYLNQERRVTWGTGLFQSVRLRYDQTFADQPLRLQILSGERFTGALGTLRYPFNQFVYIQGDLAVGAVSYFLSPLDRFFLATPEYSGADRDLLTEWNELNRGPRAQTEGTVRFGYDTLRYHPLSGPLAGTTFLAEATGGVQPFNREVYGSLRLDAAQYIPIEGRLHLMVRGGAGISMGGRYATNFQLSSFDTVRGVPFSSGSLRQWLFGRNYFFSTAELKVPLNAFIRLILFSDIEAIAGVDFGGVSNDPELLLKRRVLDYVLGVNFSLGPLQFRLHFAKPVGIGAKPRDTFTTNGMPSGGSFCNPSLDPAAGGCPADPVGDSAWVTNFSIGVAGLPGFFDRARPQASPFW